MNTEVLDNKDEKFTNAYLQRLIINIVSGVVQYNLGPTLFIDRAVNSATKHLCKPFEVAL